MFLILFLVNLLCFNVYAEEVTFHYNNTYKYNETYRVLVSKTDEYILEFGGDKGVYAAPARVTVASLNNNISYPVFITARQHGVLSWQLPMTVATPGGTVEFRNVSRTLCPHNIFSPRKLVCDSTKQSTPIIYLSTSNEDKIAVDIRVEEVHNFYVKLNNDLDVYTTNISMMKHKYNLTISPSEPMYYFYSFDQRSNLSLDVLKIQNKLACDEPLTPSEQEGMNEFLNQTESRDWLSRRDGLIERSDSPDGIRAGNKGGGWFWRPKSVILMIESDDDICAVVSIQNFSCPVFDNERDILYDGQYLTMTKAGGITLTEEQFPLGFYIVYIVKSSDEDCLKNSPIKITNSSGNLESYLNWYGSETVRVVDENGRSKTFRFAVVETISYQEYITGSGLVLAFFLTFYVAFFVSTCICPRSRGAQALVVAAENGGFEEDPRSPDVPHDGSSTSTALATDVARVGRRRRRGDAMSPVSTASESSADSELSVLARDADKDALLPSPLCLASLARVRGDVLSARSDLFKWSVLTIAVFYTLPVVQLVITYQRLLNQSGNQDLCYYNFLCAHPLGWLSDYNHVYSNIGYVMLGALFLMQVYRRRRLYRRRARHEKELGIPQHFGLLYAMGIALVSEGLLSSSYHVCPNDMNFQFDTSFMYVTAVLCMVKIYQSRHPDINASAHSTFGVLALIILIGLVGVLNASVYFWILFTMLHLVTCFVLTFKIYYFGRLTFDFGMIWRAVKGLTSTPLQSMTPTYCSRMLLLIVANLINWALAGYGMYQHKMDFASHLLVVMMGNLFMYTNFYVLMKLAHRESIRPHAWLFFLLTHTTWYTAAYFFLQQSTSWSLAPAQSRQYNSECSLLQLYDSHDIWHMLSAVAMFFSFNMYLTIDDNLSRTPREEIMVF